MTEKQVKYSIVIPTRNRAHLFKYALQCAESQTFDDYEILVSDNDSSDDMVRIAQEIRNPRVRYVRTSKTLSMPDSWEFALEKAQGEWITVLTDDSAISSRLLGEVDKTLAQSDTKIISWSHLSRYFHDTWDREAEKNTLTYHTFNGKPAVIDSETLLYKWYNFIPDHTAPVFLNSFCHRSLIAKIKNQAGRVFFHPCPDISSSVAMVANTNHYVYLDLPLGVNGIGKESIGMSQALKQGRAAVEFRDEFRDGPLFSEVPLDFPVVANYIIESLLRVKKAFPGRLKSYHIDMGLYFSHCHRSLCLLENHGVNVTREKEKLFSVLSEQPLSVRLRARGDMLRRKIALPEVKNKTRQFLRQRMNRFKPFTSLESFFRQRPEYGKTIGGRQEGFSDIAGAMAYLDRIVFAGRGQRSQAVGYQEDF